MVVLENKTTLERIMMLRVLATSFLNDYIFTFISNLYGIGKHTLIGDTALVKNNIIQVCVT